MAFKYVRPPNSSDDLFLFFCLFLLLRMGPSDLPDELVEDGEEARPAVRCQRNLLVNLKVVQVQGRTRVLPAQVGFG